MSTRGNRNELSPIIDDMVAWGFLEELPDPHGPRQTRITAFGHQWYRFLQAPHEEPGFLAAWIAAFERCYRGVDHGRDLADQMAREDVDQAAERIQAFRQDRTLYTLAKAGDVRAFHRALRRR